MKSVLGVAVSWTFLGLVCSWIVSCSSIIADDGVSVNLEQHNNGDNLPNNLQPFLPDENDAGGYIRALLCPDVPLEALPYFRFHLLTRLCYEVGTQGPCGQNMVFLKEPATKAIGKCVCVAATAGDGVSYRPLLRDPVTDQCYYMFSQAFCPDGEWLTVNPQNHNHVQCEQNPCASVRSVNASASSSTTTSASASTFETILEVDVDNDNVGDDVGVNNDTSTSTSASMARMYEDEQAEYVIFNGTCTKLDSYSEFCDPDQVLSFVHGGVLGCTEPKTRQQLQSSNDNSNDNENAINHAAVGVGDDEQQEEAENLIHRR